MKTIFQRVFLLLAFIFSLQVTTYAQLPADKGSGILYFSDLATLQGVVPNIQYGSEWAWVTGNKKLYHWDRDLAAWVEFFAASGTISPSIYTTDSLILASPDNTRNVDLNGQRLIFEDTGNGYVSILSNRDNGLFSLKKAAVADSLVVKHDFGLGGDYGLYLDGPSGLRTIFTVGGTSMALGAGFNTLKLQAPLVTDNTNTKALTIDPFTQDFELVDINQSEVTQSDIPLSQTGLIRQGATLPGVSIFDANINGGIEQKIRYDYTVHSLTEILNREFPNGVEIKDESTGAKYITQQDTIAGIPLDSITVIPLNFNPPFTQNYAVLQPEGGILRLSWFKVIPENDSITNRINLQRAMNYVGITRNSQIFCDQLDTVKLECSTSLTFEYPGRNITFFGRDSVSTLFDIYPKDLTPNGSNNFVVFDLTQTFFNLEMGVASFRDMKFIMPEQYSTSPLPTNVSWVSMQDGGGELHTNRVSIRGACKMAVYFGAGHFNGIKRVMNFENSFFEAWDDANGDATVIQYTGGRWNNYLYSNNCVYAGSGGTGHQWYIQPWLNVDAQNSTFGVNYQGGSSQVVQANQTTSGDWPDFVNTKFQRFVGCIFVEGNYSALNFDIDFFPFLEVTDCKFYNTGDKLSVKNNAVVKGNKFYNSGGSTFNTDGGDGNIVSSDNVFMNGGGAIRIFGGSVAKDINFVAANNIWRNPGANLFESRLLYAADTVRVNYNINNSSIINTNGSTRPIYISGNTGNETAYQYFNDCYFEGEIFLALGGGDHYKIYVDGGEWRSGGGHQFYTNLSIANFRGTLEIRDLRLHEYNFRVIEDRNDAGNFTRINWYFPEFEWPTDIPIQGDNRIDSINIGHGLYNITTANPRDSIVTLELYSETNFIQSITSDQFWGKYVAGILKLKAKNEFILGNSGNINLQKPYLINQSRVAELEFNRDSLYWECRNCEITNGTTLTISDADTSAVYVFQSAQTDLNYFANATNSSISGSPPSGAIYNYRIEKSLDSLVLFLNLPPGSGNSVSFDVNILR